jgi:peptidoglycan/LPS O-acetylase OafA/YrhL
MTDWSPPRTPTGQISRVPQMPGLDGMRALAVVSVMIYHANNSWLHGGFLGVEVFFVISGYLITLLLIAEHERSGQVDLKQFWLRRFRRLLPALYLMLAMMTLYLAVFKPEARGRTRGDVVAGIAYVSNWYQIWVGAGYTATEAFAPLRHLWSLAVEEQFYLVWPLIMVAILRRGRERLPRMGLWLVGVSLAITLLIAVVYVPGDINSTCAPGDSHGYWIIAGRCISINDTLYLSTITRAGGLMLGAAFAMVWRPVAIMRSPMRDKGRMLDALAIVGVAALAYLMWVVHLADPATAILTGSQFDPWLFRGGLFAAGLATLFVIAAVTHRGAMAGSILGNPLFSWVGTRSYGMYLYHWPIYQIIRQEAGKPLTTWQFVLAMLITVPITEASYRLVEMPVRRGAVGAWLRGQRRRPSASVLVRRRQLTGLGVVGVVLLGWAGVSLAMAPNRCVGVVECASQEGRQEIEAQSSTTVITVDPSIVATSPPVPTLPGAETTVAPTVAPTTTVPVADRPPLAIGESVMLGATTELQTGGFTVNADVSRQGEALANVVGQLRASGDIGKTIVIQLGTNGPVAASTYDSIMSFLPPEEVPQVLFLTVHADRGWIADNNQIIYALPSKYPNVTLLDWDGLVTSGQVPGLAGDGIHLGTGAAKQFYANYIFGALGHNELIKPLPE